VIPWVVANWRLLRKKRRRLTGMIVVAAVLPVRVRPGVPMAGEMVAAKAAVPVRMRPHQVPGLQLERREVLRVGLLTVNAYVAQLRLPMPSRVSEG
jgi:hypothetical protein